MLLITEFIQEDSQFCLTRAITRTMIGPCYTPLSLAADPGNFLPPASDDSQLCRSSGLAARWSTFHATVSAELSSRSSDKRQPGWDLCGRSASLVGGCGRVERAGMLLVLFHAAVERKCHM